MDRSKAKKRARAIGRGRMAHSIDPARAQEERVRALEDRQRLAAIRFLSAVTARLRTLEQRRLTPEDVLEIVLSAIAQTAYKRIGAVVALLRAGFDSEVGVVARTFVELTISACYIATCDDPKAAAFRFKAHTDSQTGKAFERRQERCGRMRDDTAVLERVVERSRSARERFPNIEDRNDWSGIGIRGMADAVRDPFRVLVRRLYEHQYPLLCEFAHPTWRGTIGGFVGREPTQAWLARASADVIADCVTALSLVAQHTSGGQDLDLGDLRDRYDATCEPWPWPQTTTKAGP